LRARKTKKTRDINSYSVASFVTADQFLEKQQQQKKKNYFVSSFLTSRAEEKECLPT